MKISDGLIQRLNKIQARYEEVGGLLSKPEVIADQAQFKALSKEHSDLMPIVENYATYLKHKSDFEDCEQMVAMESDADMKALAKQELDELRDTLDKDAEDIKISLLPKDPNEDNNVIMEIRAGAGGDEAALFGTELMRMYRHYAENNRWKIEEVNMNYTELGGAKELVFMITGKGVWASSNSRAACIESNAFPKRSRKAECTPQPSPLQCSPRLKTLKSRSTKTT